MMKRMIVALLAVCTVLGVSSPAFAQVKQTKEQMMFYTSDWKGDRFPDGRPKLPDSLLERARSMTIEDLWDFLQEHGYQNQFEPNWMALHIDKPMVGRAMTAQYMPTRPDMTKAINAEGKAEGRAFGRELENNSWPIAELVEGDVYVADGYGKIEYGALIGSNLGNGIFGHTHAGFVFYGGVRDQEELREIPDFNGFYKGYDPTAWAQEGLTCINCPIRIGKAVVLPGDLVLAKQEGILFIPAILAEQAVSSAEFTALTDDYNFELNREGKNGGMFEGGWDDAKYDGFQKWVESNPGKLKMDKSEFEDMVKAAKDRVDHPPAGGRRGGGGM